MKIKYLIPILMIVLVFSFTGCNKKIANETTATTAIPTTQTTIVETKTTINNDIKLFKEAIKGYNPIDKNIEYNKEALKWIKLAEKEEPNIFSGIAVICLKDLSIRVEKDYSVLVLLKEKILDKSGIQNITPEMKQMISLMIDWQDKVTKQYEYTANYYDGEGAEYDIKADELSTEADSIADEYLELLNSMK